MVDESVDVSVVVPTYQGARSLPELCARIAATLDAASLRWEIVLVDDASPDDTPTCAAELAQRHAALRYLRLPHNTGQHPATIEGLRRATGECIVTIDDDLQQQPESIPALLGALRGEVQVAVARFAAPRQAVWRRIGSALVQRRMQAGRAERLAITSFKAFRQDAAQRLVRAMPADGSGYIGATLLATFAPAELINVDVVHHPRRHGRSGYTLGRLLRMALQATRHAVGRRRA